MAVLDTTRMTVADWLKVHDAKGVKRNIILDTAAKSLGLMRDAMHFAADGPWTHTTVARVGRPSSTVRALNQYVAPTSSRYEESVDNLMILTDFNVIDALMVDNHRGGPGGGAAFRDGEVAAHVQTQLELWETNVFRGDRDSNPLSCNGMQKRYSDGVTGPNRGWIIDGGGVTNGSQASIYLMGWGEGACGCPYAPGLSMGTQHINHGKIVDTNSAGQQLTVYKDEIQMLSGFTLGDYRHSGRIANIDLTAIRALSGLQAVTATTNLLHLILRLWQKVPKAPGIKYCLYGGRDVAGALMRIALEKSSAAVRVVEAATQFGGHVGDLMVYDMPFRISDVLLPDENVVTVA